MPQAQITFQLDTDLLASIRAKCESEGVTVTESLTFAVNNALDVETMGTHHRLQFGCLSESHSATNFCGGFSKQSPS